ncbi:MAG: hypothetical protein NW201_11480 [Gemmatimonadales bacterium]|nr:hypothetical protein [Gemmatimonadales bacterium]
MFSTLLGLMMVTLTAVAGFGGYLVAKTFVRRRLRFVDAIHSPLFPAAVGVLAFVLAWPLAALPLVKVGTVAIFSIGTALGTLSGARAVGRSEHAHGRLMP